MPIEWAVMRSGLGAALLLVALAATDAAAAAPPAAAAPAAAAKEAGAAASEAERLFEEARRRIDGYRIFEACKLIEQSDALEPRTKTKYWLARCKTSIGHLASAQRLYRELETELNGQLRNILTGKSERDSATERLAVVKQDLAQIEGEVPTLVFAIAPLTASLPGVTAQLNARRLSPDELAAPLPLDAGSYTLEVSAPGHVTWRAAREVDNGASLNVAVPELAPVPVETLVVERGPALQRAFGWTAGGMGVLALAGGSVFAALAKQQYDDSLDGCDPSGGCGLAARAQQGDARLKGDVATGLVVGGSVFAAGGLALLLTAPSDNTEPKAGESAAPQAPERANGEIHARLALAPLGAELRLAW